MPSHKAPGFSEVPADLFKQAPISFQKRIHLLVNEILTGRHDCDTELLMAVQMVVQRAHWVQQQAMKESGTLIRIDLDFKNAFNSAGHSCLWAILILNCFYYWKQ